MHLLLLELFMAPSYHKILEKPEGKIYVVQIQINTPDFQKCSEIKPWAFLFFFMRRHHCPYVLDRRVHWTDLSYTDISGSSRWAIYLCRPSAPNALIMLLLMTGWGTHQGWPSWGRVALVSEEPQTLSHGISCGLAGLVCLTSVLLWVVALNLRDSGYRYLSASSGRCASVITATQL